MAFARDWAKEQRGVAFAMGLHERLGARSALQELEPGVVRMVVEQA